MDLFKRLEGQPVVVENPISPSAPTEHSGAHPSPGAATSKASAALTQPSSAELPELAAPEDGRAPQMEVK